MKTEKNKEIDLMSAVYGDVKDLSYSFAVLPWGATEPHNYHLPYMTDCYLAYGISIDAVEKTLTNYGIRGMVLPPITLGSQNPGQVGQPFCIHGRYETQRMILTDVVESLLAQGVDKLVIVNGHGGNNFKNMIRDMAIDYPEMLIASCEWFKVESQQGYFEILDDHAGEMETSVMMHYYPELVQFEKAGDGASKSYNIEAFKSGIVWIPRNWKKVSYDTGVGDPCKSTPEKGKRFADVVTTKLSDFFNDLMTKEIYTD